MTLLQQFFVVITRPPFTFEGFGDVASQLGSQVNHGSADFFRLART